MDSVKGLPQLRGDDALRMAMPTSRHEECDVSSADYVPTMKNCRAVYADVDGIIKFDYVDDSDDSTHTEVCLVSMLPPARNISKVYRYYVGTTPCDAQIYNSAGQLVNGIKIRR